MSSITTEILALSVADRLKMLELIWDSIAAVPESVTLTAEQKKLLDSRLESYNNAPNSGSPWSEVRERILNWEPNDQAVSSSK